MSAVKLIPASGGGSVSLAPPNSTSGADVTITLPSSSQTLGGSSGKILQVLENVKLDIASTTSTSFVDTGLSQAITPSATTSKILCTYNIFISNHKSAVALTNLVRGTTNLAQSTESYTNEANRITYFGGGGHMTQHSFQFLDSPNTTSSTTYKIQYRTHNASYGIFLNRWYDALDWGGASTLTLMEVAA